MLVLHIAPTPFFADRGCHIRIRNEIEALRDSGIRVILCTYPLGGEVEGIDIRRPIRIPGYTRTEVGFSPFKFPADILLFLLALGVAWRERPDVLHGHLHEGALIGWAVKCCLFWRRLPLVMDMQGSLAGELIGYGTVGKQSLLARLVGTVERIICRMPQAFFCSSARSLELLRHSFGVAMDKLVLLQDVVPELFFREQTPQALRQRMGLPVDRTVVLYTGSLLPGKGVHHIVDAIAHLQPQRPELYWVLIGYPVEDIRDRIMARGLHESIRLVGQVAYDDLAPWLAVADIALDPKEEATGEASGKILHYMAAARPVVCFDTGNNRSLLGDLGYYADKGDHAFARAILAAADDAPEERSRRGAEARARAGCEFSLAGIREVLQRQYRRWLDGSGAGILLAPLPDPLWEEAGAQMLAVVDACGEVGGLVLRLLA